MRWLEKTLFSSCRMWFEGQ